MNVYIFHKHFKDSEPIVVMTETLFTLAFRL